MVRTEGSIRFAGEPIEACSTEDIVRLGIAHVPDGRGTFAHLTVEENLRLGAYGRRDPAGVRQDFERMFGYFPRSRSGGSSRRARCRAASSRCSRWRAR